MSTSNHFLSRALLISPMFLVYVSACPELAASFSISLRLTFYCPIFICCFIFFSPPSLSAYVPSDVKFYIVVLYCKYQDVMVVCFFITLTVYPISIRASVSLVRQWPLLAFIRIFIPLHLLPAIPGYRVYCLLPQSHNQSTCNYS